MKKVLIGIGVVLVAGAAFFIVLSSSVEAPESDEPVQESPITQSTNTQEQETFDKDKYSIDAVDSLWLIVNKERPIDQDYVPANLEDVQVEKREDKSDEELMLRQEAGDALDELFSAAAAEGIDLLMGSAYRSYELQNYYYTNYVSTYGQTEADRFSARPGTSEHQTGLAVDVSGVDRTCYLEICFEETEAGQWVKEHAHEYGFIIRYPEGKEDITGYQYEPWHLRYVGLELASELHESNQTLEEFFNL